MSPNRPQGIDNIPQPDAYVGSEMKAREMGDAQIAREIQANYVREEQQKADALLRHKALGRAATTSSTKPILSWRQRAACRGVDPEVFYPVADSEAEEAKVICAGCPVRMPCLEYALANRERDGVWGGTTEGERRRMVRQGRNQV